MYEYKAHVVEVTDGDTVKLNVDLGFHVTHRINLRLLGVDAPETRTKDMSEKERGLKSKAFLEGLVLNREVIVTTNLDKTFDRYVGTLYLKDGLNVNSFLVEEGYAKPYMP